MLGSGTCVDADAADDDDDDYDDDDPETATGSDAVSDVDSERTTTSDVGLNVTVVSSFASDRESRRLGFVERL